MPPTIPIVTVTTSTTLIPKHRSSAAAHNSASSEASDESPIPHLDHKIPSPFRDDIEHNNNGQFNNQTSSPIMNSSSNTSIFFVICFCYSFFCSGLSISMIGPLLPSFVSQINLSNYREGDTTKVSLEDLGLVFPSRGLGTMLGSLLGGFLLNYSIKRCSRLQHLIPLLFSTTGAILMLCAKVSLLFAAKVQVFAIIYFVVGFSHGLINVSSSSYILAKFPKEKVTFYFQLLNALFGLGAVFGPFMTAITKKYYSKSIQTNIIAIAILSDSATTKAIVITLILLSISIFLYISEIKKTKPISSSSPQKETSSVTNWSSRNIRIILSICFGIICVTGVEHGVGGTLYSFIHTKNLTTESEASMINSSFWLSFTLGRIISIFLSYHMRSSSILVMDLVGSLLSSVLFLLFNDNVSSIWVATILLGLSLSSQYPTLLSFPSSYLDIKVSSIITSLFIVCGGVGSMVLPYIMISLFKLKGPESMFYVLFFTLVLVSFVYSYLILGFKKKIVDPYLGGIISDTIYEDDTLKRRK